MKPTTKEKILLASIPVLGVIIAAALNSPNFNCKSKTATIIDSVAISKHISILKNKAGKINDMLVFKRYDDILSILPFPLKANITKRALENAQDSLYENLGSYIKSLDTTTSSLQGATNCFIKNQYQKGTNINQVIFDGEGNIIGLYTTFHSQN